MKPQSNLIELPESGSADNRVAAILQTLNAEIAAQSEYVALLNAQTEALIVCDRAGYSLLHEKHEKLLTDAEQRSFRFKSFAPEACDAADRSPGSSLRQEIESWPEPVRAEALNASRKLCDIAGEVQQLTDRNRALIRGELSLIAFQLNFILSSAQQHGENYASTGAAQILQSRQLLNSVA